MSFKSPERGRAYTFPFECHGKQGALRRRRFKPASFATRRQSRLLAIPAYVYLAYQGYVITHVAPALFLVIGPTVRCTIVFEILARVSRVLFPGQTDLVLLRRAFGVGCGPDDRAAEGG